MKKKILVIDVGGTNVKAMISRSRRRKFRSGPKMTPREMVAQVKEEIEDWKFDAISIGFPAPVRDGRILNEPKHLGKGWVGFNFEKAFGKPVRILNDAGRSLPAGERISGSRAAKGERGIWQRRYWEHTIRDERDFARHLDYIHINPVKHGLVARVRDWPFSSFHRMVKLGIYPEDWAGDTANEGADFGEPD